MRTFLDRLIGHAFQCFINLLFLYGQYHAVCVLGLACDAVGTVVLRVMTLISAFLFLVPKFRLGKEECMCVKIQLSMRNCGAISVFLLSKIKSWLCLYSKSLHMFILIEVTALNVASVGVHTVIEVKKKAVTLLSEVVGDLCLCC